MKVLDFGENGFFACSVAVFAFVAWQYFVAPVSCRGCMSSQEIRVNATVYGDESLVLVGGSDAIRTIVGASETGTVWIGMGSSDDFVTKVEGPGEPKTGYAVYSVRGPTHGASLWRNPDLEQTTVHLSGQWPAQKGVADQLFTSIGNSPPRAVHSFPFSDVVVRPVERSRSPVRGFAWIERNGLPVATSEFQSVGVPLRSWASSAGPTAHTSLMGWDDKPTILDARYRRSPTESSVVSLAVSGWSGSEWFQGLSLEPAKKPNNVSTSSELRLLQPLISHRHDGVLVRVQAVEESINQRMVRELRATFPVPGTGERSVRSFSAVDLPQSFRRISWDARRRVVSVDWGGVKCSGADFVYQRTVLRVVRPSGSFNMVWEIETPVAEELRLPMLPGSLQEELEYALSDPAVRLGLEVGAVATWGSFDDVVSHLRLPPPASVGERYCYVSRQEELSAGGVGL